MPFDPQIHHRQSIRLQKCNYADNGAYFITICTQNKECLLGRIVDNGRGTKFCALSEIGKIAKECWLEIPRHYPNVILDEFVIMPNHVHGIINIGNGFVGVQNFEPLPPQTNQFQKIIPQSIGAIVRGYKIGVTKWARANTNIYNLWQRNYFEHIIRNEKSLNEIQKYILNNPYNWEQDEMFIR